MYSITNRRAETPPKKYEHDSARIYWLCNVEIGEVNKPIGKSTELSENILARFPKCSIL